MLYSKFKENFTFLTALLFWIVIIFSGFSWADSNGVWHFAKDIVPGTFGEDQGANQNNNYTFINPVFFLNSSIGIGSTFPKTKLYVDGNLNVSNTSDVCIDNDVCLSEMQQIPQCKQLDQLVYYNNTWRCTSDYWIPKSCLQILNDGLSVGDGEYIIDPDQWSGEDPFEVYCDMTTLGGGWTRISLQGGSTGFSHSAWTNGEGTGGNINSPGHVSKAYHTLNDFSDIKIVANTGDGGGDVSNCMSVNSTLYELVEGGGSCDPVAIAGMTKRVFQFKASTGGGCSNTRIATHFQSYDNGQSYYWYGAGGTGHIGWGTCYGHVVNYADVYIR